MSEFDFDELLDEVLREEARTEPRLGMEQRVLARVSLGVRSSSRRWRMWSAVAVSAASVLMIVWMHARPVPNSVSKMRTMDALSQTVQPVGSVTKSMANASKLPLMSVETKRRMTGKRSKASPQLLQEVPIQIAEIEIAPLEIAPLEIASLTSSGFQKGRKR